jgi:hypothetical protein
LPINPPFTCDFDAYSIENNDACNGIAIETTNGAKLTTVSTEPLPIRPSTIITDFTSIAGSTVTNKNCQIPFLYNNVESYFCALNQSRFVCAVNQNNDFDYCNLGKIIHIYLILNC